MTVRELMMLLSQIEKSKLDMPVKVDLYGAAEFSYAFDNNNAPEYLNFKSLSAIEEVDDEIGRCIKLTWD